MAKAPRSSFGAADIAGIHTPPLLTGRIKDLLAGKKDRHDGGHRVHRRTIAVEDPHGMP